MAISVFDLFKIGIGPSSSHTVGPMRAALIFAHGLDADGLLDRVAAIRAELFGSLGATGIGHGSHKAVMLGLEGAAPETVDTGTVAERLARIRETGRLCLLGRNPIAFAEKDHLVLHRRKSLPHHPNGMRFTAYDADGLELRAAVYYSCNAKIDPRSGCLHPQSRREMTGLTYCNDTTSTVGEVFGAVALRKEKGGD